MVAANMSRPTIEDVVRMVELILRNLVDHPEDAKVLVNQGTQTVILEVVVAKEDRGKVIGRQGRTADAIRVIVNAAAACLDKKLVFQLIE